MVNELTTLRCSARSRHLQDLEEVVIKRGRDKRVGIDKRRAARRPGAEDNERVSFFGAKYRDLHCGMSLLTGADGRNIVVGTQFLREAQLPCFTGRPM